MHFTWVQICHTNSPILWNTDEVSPIFFFNGWCVHQTWILHISLKGSALPTGIIADKQLINRALMMCIYEGNWVDLFFYLLKHGNNKDSPIVSPNDETRVISWGINHRVCYFLIREEELKLILVVEVSDNQGVEVDKAMARRLRKEIDIVWEQRDFEFVYFPDLS